VWDLEAAKAADIIQAGYFREYLQGERSILAMDLAQHVKHLTRCMNTGRAGAEIANVRRVIRSVEAEMRAIDRMTGALDQSFPRVQSASE
jgi:hypothetical protein